MYQNEIMNYSFILPDNKELSNLKIKITGKDPINLIENDATYENIIKLKDKIQWWFNKRYWKRNKIREKVSNFIEKYCTFCRDRKRRKSTI